MFLHASIAESPGFELLLVVLVRKYIMLEELKLRGEVFAVYVAEVLTLVGAQNVIAHLAASFFSDMPTSGLK